MIWHIPLEMLRCVLMTMAVETFLAFLLKYRKKDLLLVTLVNILTNPLVTGISFFCVIMFGRKTLGFAVFILEAAVFVTEGLVYRKFLIKRKPNPFLLSFILNSSSYILGELFNHFF